MLSIYKALKVLFADDGSGVRRLKVANTDLLGSGSPLDRMLRGGSIGLIEASIKEPTLKRSYRVLRLSSRGLTEAVGRGATPIAAVRFRA